ncbi:MAG: hypothetical protein AAGA23_06075 [Pseudomonadota bacterium]
MRARVHLPATAGVLLAAAVGAQEPLEDAPGPSMGLLEFIAQFSTEEGEWLDPEALNQELGMLDQSTKEHEEKDADNSKAEADPEADPETNPGGSRDDEAAADPDRPQR